MLGWLAAVAAFLLAAGAALCFWAAEIHVAVEDRLESSLRLKLAGAVPVLSAAFTLSSPWPRQESPQSFAVLRCRAAGLPVFSVTAQWNPPGPEIIVLHARVLGWPVKLGVARRQGQWTVNGKPTETLRTVRLYRRLRTRPLPARAILGAVTLRQLDLWVGGAMEADRAALLSGLLRSLDGIARARGLPCRFRWHGGEKKHAALRAQVLMNLVKLVTLSRETKQRKGISWNSSIL